MRNKSLLVNSTGTNQEPQKNKISQQKNKNQKPKEGRVIHEDPDGQIDKDEEENKQQDMINLLDK